MCSLSVVCDVTDTKRHERASRSAAKRPVTQTQISHTHTKTSTTTQLKKKGKRDGRSQVRAIRVQRRGTGPSAGWLQCDLNSCFVTHTKAWRQGAHFKPYTPHKNTGTCGCCMQRMCESNVYRLNIASANIARTRLLRPILSSRRERDHAIVARPRLASVFLFTVDLPGAACAHRAASF